MSTDNWSVGSRIVPSGRYQLLKHWAKVTARKEIAPITPQPPSTMSNNMGNFGDLDHFGHSIWDWVYSCRIYNLVVVRVLGSPISPQRKCPADSLTFCFHVIAFSTCFSVNWLHIYWGLSTSRFLFSKDKNPNLNQVQPCPKGTGPQGDRRSHWPCLHPAVFLRPTPQGIPGTAGARYSPGKQELIWIT